MSDKRKLKVPDNQLTLIDMEPVSPRPAPPRKHKKPKGPKRISSLEDRVTSLEAEATLIKGQLEREEEPEEYDA